MASGQLRFLQALVRILLFPAGKTQPACALIEEDAKVTGIAIKLLFSDNLKACGLVFGVAFATLLIMQQGGLFVGLMTRVQNVIAEAIDIDIWVMDQETAHLGQPVPLAAGATARVRAIPGVAEAWPLIKTNLQVRGAPGHTVTALLLGVDETSFAGASRRFAIGSLNDLTRPDAIAIDQAGYKKLWPGEEIKPGRVLELNGRRASIVAVTNAPPAFGSQAVIYTGYRTAMNYAPQSQNGPSFVLVKAASQADADDLAAAISRQTGLKARPSSAFSSETVRYYVGKTGIAINFATTIILGIIVGLAITGLTFSLFVSDNLKHYAVLKAVGLENRRLTQIILSQVGLVSAIGFFIGTGLAVGFFELVSTPTSAFRGFILPWWIPAGTLVVMAIAVLLSTLAGLRRVLSVEPASVFRA